MPARPSAKIEAGKLRYLTLWCQPQNQSQQVPQSWELTEEIGDSRSKRAQPRPSINHAKGVGSQRTPLTFVIVRKEFRLVGRNVDVRRALRFAGFARKAQIE